MSNKAVAFLKPGSATAPIFASRRSYPGIDSVLQLASNLVAKYTGREDMRNLALKITNRIQRHPETGLPDMRNIDGVAQALYRWVTRNINYVRDPWNIERIQSPDVTIRQKAGDCDDHAILGATLLQSLGIPTGFRVVSRTGRNYDHIYVVFKTPTVWKSFDTTVTKYPGYEFDEQLIKKSKYIPNATPDDLGIDPITITAAATTALQTGVTMKKLFSNWFGAKDKDERIARGQWRDYLMAQGVRSDVISFSQKDNAILQRYAQIIQEVGQPAINHLNRYGDLGNSFLAEQKKNRNRKWGLYGGLTLGAVMLTGAGLWAFNHP